MFGGHVDISTLSVQADAPMSVCVSVYYILLYTGLVYICIIICITIYVSVLKIMDIWTFQLFIFFRGEIQTLDVWSIPGYKSTTSRWHYPHLTDSIC